MEIRFQTEFHERFKSGDKISVKLSKYVNDERATPEHITKQYEIGKTDLNEGQGQVELFYGNKSMIVEYQWFNETLTRRKITIIK